MRSLLAQERWELLVRTPITDATLARRRAFRAMRLRPLVVRSTNHLDRLREEGHVLDFSMPLAHHRLFTVEVDPARVDEARTELAQGDTVEMLEPDGHLLPTVRLARGAPARRRVESEHADDLCRLRMSRGGRRPPLHVRRSQLLL